MADPGTESVVAETGEVTIVIQGEELIQTYDQVPEADAVLPGEIETEPTATSETGTNPVITDETGTNPTITDETGTNPTRTDETGTDPAGIDENQKPTDQEDGSVEQLIDEMGNCVASCSRCCGGKKDGYSQVPGVNSVDTPPTSRAGSKKELSSEYAWEQKVMEENILKSGKIFRAAIVSSSNGELRAAGPKGFRPNTKAIQHIIKALEGDTSGIAEDMIDLGGGCSVCSPGKVDPGKAIYGADGKGGGCAIFKTKECVLITVYRSDPAPATRLAAEVAEYMEEDNNK